MKNRIPQSGPRASGPAHSSAPRGCTRSTPARPTWLDPRTTMAQLKALVWFWLINETISANLVYQDDYEIGSTTPSDEAMTKIMTMVIAW